MKILSFGKTTYLKKGDAVDVTFAEGGRAKFTIRTPKAQVYLEPENGRKEYLTTVQGEETIEVVFSGKAKLTADAEIEYYSRGDVILSYSVEHLDTLTKLKTKRSLDPLELKILALTRTNEQMRNEQVEKQLSAMRQDQKAFQESLKQKEAQVDENISNAEGASGNGGSEQEPDQREEIDTEGQSESATE